MNKVDLLRKKYPEFIYSDHSYKCVKNNLEIVFNFLIKPDLKFRTRIVIKNVKQKGGLDNLIFHLGLIEMLNYWKATCSPKITIAAGNLHPAGIKLLKEIIMNGMGQYFYENKINFLKKGFLNIECNKAKKTLPVLVGNDNQNNILIPIGGGKDTPVTIEILKDKKNILNSFILNPRKSQLEIAKTAGLNNTVIVERIIDKKLIEFNKSKGLNGHVPFSAFLSCLSIIIAYLQGSNRIAFSWEKSSSEPNINYLKKPINHQWSKSIQFEKLFNVYSQKYLVNHINIFSPTRNFSELQIAEIFSKLEKYHKSFLSCNTAYKIGAKNAEWCGKCPKCLSVYLYLYPFLGKQKLKEIFKKNLLEDKNLIPLLKQLIGKEKFKPFECVGTIKENKMVVDLIKKMDKDNSKSILFKI